MKISKRIFLIILLFVPVVHAAANEHGYITDDFEVMMRSGPSMDNKIIKQLKSGVALTMLRESAGNGHSQVQTTDGEIGYVLSRFVSTTPAARSELQALEKQLKGLLAEPNVIRTELADSQDENKQLIKQNFDLTKKNQILHEELNYVKKITSGGIDLIDQNQKLSDEIQQLVLEVDDARIRNETLKDQSDKRWFMMGVLAIVLGLFLGWVLSMAKRRNTGW